MPNTTTTTTAKPKTASIRPEAIAKNPNTPASTMRALYEKSSGQTVLAAITRNPTTPLDLLTKRVMECHAPAAQACLADPTYRFSFDEPAAATG